MFKKSVSLCTAFVLVLIMVLSAFGAIASAASYSTYDLTLVVDKNSNTAVLTAKLPAGVQSGKIVFDTSDKLSLVEGSLSSDITLTVYEDYDREGVSGSSVAFAYTENYATGTVVFTARFTVNGNVSSVTADDINVKLWNLSNGRTRLATQANGDVNKSVVFVENYTVTFNAGVGGSVVGDTQISVPAGTAVADILPSVANGGLAFDAGFGFKSYSVTNGTVTGNMTVNINFYRIGDVNGDDLTDNLDAAYILRHDALLVLLEGDQALAADVNFDGIINSLDAANVLKFDADLIGPFQYLAE